MKLPLLLMLLVLSPSLLAQNDYNNVTSKTIFFDSIIEVWVPPTKGCYTERETREWNPCTKEYEKVIIKEWEPGTPGFYRKVSVLFCRKGGVTMRATPKILSEEFSKYPETKKAYESMLKTRSNILTGGILTLIGAGMFSVQASLLLDGHDPIRSPMYWLSATGITIAGLVICSNNSDKKYVSIRDVLNVYNKETNTKMIHFSPVSRLVNGRWSKEFGIRLKF